MHTRPKTRRGFTLVEVILVVVILAALAAVFAVVVGGRGEQTRIQLAEAAVSDLEQQVDQYELLMGQYPSEDQGLNALVEGPLDEELREKWKGAYVKPEKLNDPWGEPYEYELAVDGEEQPYRIWSKGPDKVSGTEDDIQSWQEEQ